MKPVEYLEQQVLSALHTFEDATSQTVKSIRLVRLDKPVIFRGSSTDLVEVEITIRG